MLFVKNIIFCITFVRMAPKKLLSEVQRANIVFLSEQGMNQVEIAKKLNCSRKAVQIAIKRFAETGLHRNRPRSGRKRITAVREDRQLVRQSLRNRKLTSSQLAQQFNSAFNKSISSKTVRRRLIEGGLRGCKARRKPWLSEKNKKIRLDWAKKYKNWTSEDWAQILWSDETNIELFGTPGAIWVRRRPREAFLPECLVPTMKFGGGSVMIWGCMATSGVGEMFICEGRMNSTTYTTMLSEVLEPSLLKLFENEDYKDVWFQQDNAPCHKSIVSMAWFKNNGITVLDWPPQSPDLNPIEHLWPILKKKLATFNFKSKTELKQKLIEEWAKIVPATCKGLVDSMPRRIAAVIKAKGGTTKY